MTEMSSVDKAVFRDEVRKFIQCLLYNGFKASSIARACGLSNTHRIKHNSIGYDTAVKLVNEYTNNWEIWLERKACMK